MSIADFCSFKILNAVTVAFQKRPRKPAYGASQKKAARKVTLAAVRSRSCGVGSNVRAHGNPG